MTGQTWKVVGGGSTGGIVVRRGRDLKSPEEAERLSTGALIEQLELHGQRLCFKRMSGTGPDTGWVSLKYKDSDLVVRAGPDVDLHGAEVWIVTQGSRGDMQPCLALAVGLREAGCKLRIFSSRDHERFVSSFGIPFTGVCEGQMFLRKEFMDKLTEEEREHQSVFGMAEWKGNCTEGDVLIFEELARSKPDLLLYSHMHHGLGLLAWRVHGVRSLKVHYAYESFEAVGSIFHRYQGALGFDSMLASRGITTKPCLQGMTVGDFCHHLTSPDSLNGVTALYKVNLSPEDQAVAEKLFLMGNFALTDVEGAEDPQLFGGRDGKAKLQAFIDAGAPPVYAGWGSCPPWGGDFPSACFTLALCLKMNKRRGIILGGFSDLSFEMLEQGIERYDPTENNQLRAFARENILFIKSAPHEWLFPKCSAIIHHGGAGTTAAALRAGVPSIVMPCGYDQFDTARWIAKLGCGLELVLDEQFSWQMLSKAVRKCTSDAALKARAKELGETIRSEQGVASALLYIDKVIKEVRSGAASSQWEAERAKWEPIEESVARSERRPRVVECFSFFCKLLRERGSQLSRELHGAIVQIETSDGDQKEKIVVDLKSEPPEVRWGGDQRADFCVKMPHYQFQGFAEQWHVAWTSIDGDSEKAQLVMPSLCVLPPPQHWTQMVKALAEYASPSKSDA